MRVCVVGQGPSAEGKGAEIDRCDFVVRMMAFWQWGAKHAGIRTNALALFGWGHWLERPPLKCEFWYTHCWAQMSIQDAVGWQRLEFLTRVADLQPIRWLPERLWHRLADHIDAHPSTGMVAVAMALEILKPAELVLYGFDSTLPDRPNYADARRPMRPRDLRAPPHDVLAEKRAIAEIAEGRWLGEPCEVKLTWPDKPPL